ncbi:helix-turn-helix domain-containing protein [Clostridium psychrophilum]|uniref:helix-turn-helix domain-containing protein n=1 Tax=Clostridium psychrophilum TaxID=132926 RepID=UPI001C0A94D4|nr:helix-turn-helix transcriptional regulator [Clostridium psychrophilum]MBU3181620.1 helix-turn-helix domain-containing protein [Clostridium psychrophilum]
MQNEVNYVKIGNRIRIEREKFDMTREKFSELLNLSPYFLGQIERGERKMSINTLINISECLHISIDSLFFEQINANTNNDVLHSLINKCSEKEVKVIEGLIKLLLPHLSR